MKQLMSRVMLWVPLMLIGCGNAALGPDMGFDAAQLELEDGGFDDSDELPMFGIEADVEQALADAFFLDELVEVSDSMESDPSISEMTSGTKTYFLDLAWGELRLFAHFRGGWDTLLARAETIDWSGTIVASEGVALKVLRVARGEPRIEIHQTSPRMIGFSSQTRGRGDGLLLEVTVGPQVPADATVLSFMTPSGNFSWSLRELETLDAVHDNVNAAGDRVAANAMARRPSCPGGFLHGRWIRYDDHGGRMRGVLLSENGAVTGHLRGIWGIRRNGEQVLFAKAIDNGGRFIGLMGGTWSTGAFRAVFRQRGVAPLGEAHGQFREEEGRGFFRGRWSRLDCQ